MLDAAAYVPAVKQLKGRARKVRLVVMHATQSKERKGAARAVAGWFANPDAKGSAHVTVDDRETIESVKPQNTAAGAPGANQDGYHIEQVGYSEQGEAEWLDAYSEAVIERAAGVARWACEHFDIPKVWLSVQDVRDGKAGITDHDTITKAMRRGSHWDPGPHWPRGRFMALVTQEDDVALTPAQEKALALIPAVHMLATATNTNVARLAEIVGELAGDVPDNVAAEIDEIRRNVRAVGDAVGAETET